MSGVLRVVVRPSTWLVVYLFALAAVVFSPARVDSQAGELIRDITAQHPALTHARLELIANVLLFVPLGFLTTLIVRQRFVVLPIVVVCAVAIEFAQEMFLDARIGSMRDIVANIAGACAGMILAAIWLRTCRAWARHRWRRRNASGQALEDQVPTVPPDRALG